MITTPAELDALVGVGLGPGSWTCVSAERVATFAAATGWAGPPGLAPEWLGLAMMSSLAEELYRLELGTARLNYGLDRVRFPGPLPVGARVRMRACVAAAEPREPGLLVSLDLTLEVEDAEQPACTARKRSLVLLA